MGGLQSVRACFISSSNNVWFSLLAAYFLVFSFPTIFCHMSFMFIFYPLINKLSRLLVLKQR